MVSVRIVTKSGVSIKHLGDEFSKKIKAMTKKVDSAGTISVGLHSDAQGYHDDGGKLGGHITDVVMVGALNEFGTGTIPSRPWLARSFEVDAKFYAKQLKGMYKGILSHRGQLETLNRSMDALGEIAVQNIRDHVESNSIGLISNAVATQLLKGGNTPMIDTGHLLSQVSHKRFKR